MKRTWQRLAILAVAVAGFGLATTPTSATLAGTDGRIAFSGNPAPDVNAGDRDIWTVNPDGTGAFNVTDAAGAPAFNLESDWSPDGGKIVFRGGRADAAEIYTVNANGTGLTQLTNNSFKDYAPTWSPDGTKIAFASNRNDPNFATCVGIFAGCVVNIFVMPATGGSPVQVTFDSATDQNPAFSPDGKFIAYSSSSAGSTASAIYKVDLTTLAVTKLTPDSLRAGYPAWSPDGTRIAFTSNFYECTTETSDCKADIYVMDADGNSITRLTSKFRNNGNASWSPEGGKLAFTHSDSALINVRGIYTMNSDGTGITRITPTNWDCFLPTWGSG
jgi:Tol biopolymer transport system component